MSVNSKMQTMKTLDRLSCAGLIALATLCAACSGGREHLPPSGGQNETPNEQPNQQDPVDSGVPAAPIDDAGATLPPYPIFDGSTTPTAENVRGVDAAAGEEARGSEDPLDAGAPDAQ